MILGMVKQVWYNSYPWTSKMNRQLNLSPLDHWMFGNLASIRMTMCFLDGVLRLLSWCLKSHSQALQETVGKARSFMFWPPKKQEPQESYQLAHVHFEPFQIYMDATMAAFCGQTPHPAKRPQHYRRSQHYLRLGSERSNVSSSLNPKLCLNS